MTIGVLGGTFDPVHNAHLRLAEEAAAALHLAEVRLIPAGEPYHRAGVAASPEHRLAMLALAVRDHPILRVDDRDVRRPGATYTVDTLQSLRADLGSERPLVLILGADAFLGLESWREWRRILDLAHIAVAARPGHADWRSSASPGLAAEIARRYSADSEVLKHRPGGAIVSFVSTPMDISATAVRERLAAGGKVRDLLPAPVLDYIGKCHLYAA